MALIKNDSLRIGVSFGITSAIITTLGLMVGLNSGTGSKMVVLGGILTIAIADAFSDALGIHITEESEGKHSLKEIWQSTIFTFLAKFIFALTFVIPVLLFTLSTAVIINIVWGLLVLGIISFKIAKDQKKSPFKMVSEHLVIAVLVILITNYLGEWIAKTFN
jgi:VIT1/CCC1 family predicted Fe2+/Mn2+ transporter